MTRRVTVDQELCIGSAECVRLVPAAFALDEAAGVSIPLPGAADAPIDELLAAALNCPTNAISVTSEDGEVLVASNG